MFALTLLLLTVAADPEFVAIPPEAQILDGLRQQHPRLIATAEDLDRVKALIANDPRAAKIYRKVRRDADQLLDSPDTVEHKIVGPRLLGESRKCLDRVYTLATVYRISGDRRYADRARKEMLTAAAFKDWNPSHFLDTAEMTHALAIGYDWLYEDLSPDDGRRSARRSSTRGCARRRRSIASSSGGRRRGTTGTRCATAA